MALEENDSDTAYKETVENLESNKIVSATKPSFSETMNERKAVSRWFITRVFVIGIFCGVCLGVIFMWLAFVAS